MQSRSDLIWANVKAFVVSWLTASLLFPLFAVLTGANYSYAWGVALMLMGIVMPYVLVPSLLGILLINWVALRYRKLFSNPFSCILLGALGSSVAFLIFFLVWTASRNGFVTGSMQGIGKIVGFMLPAGAIFGFFYYFLVAGKRAKREAVLPPTDKT
jgi:uncharacterized membrane protein